jgi:hypothetical protein
LVQVAVKNYKKKLPHPKFKMSASTTQAIWVFSNLIITNPFGYDSFRIWTTKAEHKKRNKQ